MPSKPEPPETVSLRWCPVCGREDRFKHLRPGGEYPHRGQDGKLCPGEVVTLVYRLTDQGREALDG